MSIMNKQTKISLVNAGANILSVTIGIVSAIGIEFMKKEIYKSIEENDSQNKKQELRKLRIGNILNRKK